MENCLVEKLKGAIDNNSLSKLATMLYHVDGTQSSDSVLSVKMKGASNAKIVNNTDGAYFTNQGGTENYGIELNSIPQNGTVYIARGTCDIEVYSKYVLGSYSNDSSVKPDFETMNYCGYNAESFIIDLSKESDTEFDWFNGSKIIKITASTTIYELAELKERIEALNCLDKVDAVVFNSVNVNHFGLDFFLNFPNINNLQLNQCIVSGDFANLGALTSLNKIILTNQNITGSIEEFVLNQRDNGRVTSTKVDTWYFNFSNITWRGVRNNLANVSHISWTETTITVHPQGGTADTRTYYKDSEGTIITD